MKFAEEPNYFRPIGVFDSTTVKMAQKNIWGKMSSCTVAVVYHFCMENHLSKTLFFKPFPKKKKQKKR